MCWPAIHCLLFGFRIHKLRDDRELVRARLDGAEKAAGLKTQIRGLLKRNRLARPDDVSKGWSRSFRAWLRGLCRESKLGRGIRQTLASQLRQLSFLEREIERLDCALMELAEQPRYQPAVAKLCQLDGVALVTALVFLTELGNIARFSNRRQISAYLGLVPQCHESGSAHDRKGHITRQGPSRVRRVLCQATWARVRRTGSDQDAYQRIVKKNPKHKKIAVVAAMRRLAVRMWHQVLAARSDIQRAGPLQRDCGMVRGCATPPLQLA